MSEQNSKPLCSLTVGEYMELNKKAFSEEAERLLQERSVEHSKKAPGDIIFIHDVLQLTGYKRSTLYSKVSRCEIPVLSRKKPLTFSRKAILRWLKEGKPHALDQEANPYLNHE